MEDRAPAAVDQGVGVFTGGQAGDAHFGAFDADALPHVGSTAGRLDPGGVGVVADDDAGAVSGEEARVLLREGGA